MVVLVSSVVAGAASLFNRSSGNSQISVLNDRINSAVNSCMQFLPNGTPTCDSQLGSVISKICNGENNNEQQRSVDACHDGKIAQYYKIRNTEIVKRRSTIIANNNNNTIRS
jgi:hypothetical protein